MKPPKYPLAPASEADLVHPDEPESRLVVAFMGGHELKGLWDPPGEIRAISVMGGTKLDFREADLLEGVTEIRVLAVMGGVEIVVPSDVSVECQGIGILGGFPSFGRQAPEPDAPVLRIRGLAIMGGVDVKVR